MRQRQITHARGLGLSPRGLGLSPRVRINLDRPFDRTAPAAPSSGRRPIGPTNGPHGRFQKDAKWTSTEKGNKLDTYNRHKGGNINFLYSAQT
uniref:Uncharacterized protein n=1 Tax=Oryza barthii TaxID=65489 RepID=A0A0D3FST4_9ORYZ